MAAKGTTVMRFIGDDAALLASFKRVQSGAKGVEGTATKTSTGMHKMGMAAKVASVAVLGMGVALVKGFVEAGMNAETTQTRLTKVLQNTHQESAKNITIIDRYAAAEKSRGFSADEVRDSLTRLITSTHNVAAATHLSAVASDLARAKNISLAQAADVLARMHAGQFRALKSLGIMVPKVTTAQDALKASTKHATVEQQRHAKALDHTATSAKALVLLEKNVHGQAAAFAGTDAGKIDVFKASWQNLQQSIGEQLIPVLSKLMGYINSLMGFISAHKQTVEVLAASFGGLAVGVLVINKIVGAWKSLSNAASAVGTAATTVIGWFKATDAAAVASTGVQVEQAAVQKATWISTAATAIANAAKIAAAWVLANPVAAGIAAAVAVVGLAFYALSTRETEAQRVAEGLKAQNEALSRSFKTMQDSVNAAKGALSGLVNANLDLRQAHLNVIVAQAHVNQLTADGQKGTADYKQAVIDLARAQQGVKDAATGVTAAQDKANKSVTDAAGSTSKYAQTAKDATTRADFLSNAFKGAGGTAELAASAHRHLVTATDNATGSLKTITTIAEGVATSVGKVGPAANTAQQHLHDLANTDLSKGSAVSSARHLGTNIVAGVATGIAGGTVALGNAFSVVIASAVAAGKRAAKVSSPSKLTADEIGKPLMQGIAKGVTDYVGYLATAITSAVATAVYKAHPATQALLAKLGLTQKDTTSPGTLAYALSQLTPQVDDDFSSLTTLVTEAVTNLAHAYQIGPAAVVAAAGQLKQAQDALAGLGVMQRMPDGSLVPLTSGSEQFTAPAGTAPGAGFTILSAAAAAAASPWAPASAPDTWDYSPYQPASGGSSGGSGGGSGNSYTLNVTAIDPASAGTAVIQAIDAWEARNGQRYARV